MKLEQQETPGHLWTGRRIKEESKSYEISHSERRYTYSAYAFAKCKDQPFNLMIRYEFKRAGNKFDVANVRDTAQNVRVQLANIKADCNLIWSRNVAWGSDIEEVCILVSVPQKHINNFIDLARGWRDGIDVHLVSYGEDFEHDGRQVNVLDYMLRATSNETVCKDLSVLSERSDLIYGYRVWCSWNLKSKHRGNYCKPQADDQTTTTH